MSDELPIAQVPESTWLRVLAHALDPDAEAGGESLVPQDDADPQDDASGPDDDADPWDEDPADGSEPEAADSSGTESTAGEESLGAVDDLGGWGEPVDVDDIVVADGEAAVDNYTAALPEEHDDAPDDAGW